MKIGIISDVHFEFFKDRPDLLLADNDIFLQLDVLILAGDIGVYLDGTLEKALSVYCENFPDTRIVFVPGNHEFYASNYPEADMGMDGLCEELGVIYLNNDWVDIEDWTFFGSVMWSDVISMAVAPGDFSISYDDYGIEPINAYVVKQEHEFAKRQLNECLGESDPRKTFVITHFSPDVSFGNPRFPENGLTFYFSSTDLKPFLGMDYSRSDLECPAYWVFGHTHYNCDVDTGPTRVISNQRGYPKEKGELTQTIKVIEV